MIPKELPKDEANEKVPTKIQISIVEKGINPRALNNYTDGSKQSDGWTGAGWSITAILPFIVSPAMLRIMAWQSEWISIAWHPGRTFSVLAQSPRSHWLPDRSQ
jgi:hypothetical protein